MNAEEMKIGMYTEDEIFQYMTEQEGGMLGRSMYDAIFDKMHALITETEQLKKDNLILKEKLEASEKARKEAIELVKNNQRKDEIARLIAGSNITEKTMEHATEIIELAKRSL